MPRCPAKDYADRCHVIELEADGCTHHAIAEALHRPERWVRRTLARYDARVGGASLKDHSSRPRSSPDRTASDVETAICDMKQAHPEWGRRQIASQLCWQWRDEPARCQGITPSRVRCVLKRHPEFAPPPPAQLPPPRQIDYLTCNLLWAADCHQTRLMDGSTWDTLQWIDLHSRFALGQLTAATLTEELVVRSFLQVAARYGLPSLVKTDLGHLFYEPSGGLPTLFERVTAALDVVHVPVGPCQPWWNGVIERRIETCQQEVHLPQAGDATAVNDALEAERQFYNNERCHSRCDDQPPVTQYMPSARLVPADFALDQVPITLQPMVITRQVQAGGRISLLRRSYHFSQRYAHQAVTVTVDGWTATAEAADGWTRTWDLHPTAPPQPAPPLPPVRPQPLLRTVNKHGCISVSRHLYYIAAAWAGHLVTLAPQPSGWLVHLPDGSTKSLPDAQNLTFPRRHPFPVRPTTAPGQPPAAEMCQTRHVTRTGQIRFHTHLYYVGVTHHGQTVQAVPVAEGLAIYTLEHAWLTTCPWPTAPKPDEPLYPT